MLRLLRFRRGPLFFKRIITGLRLVRSSFKAIIFQHHKYFIFCLAVSTIQLLRIVIIGLFDPYLSKPLLITELFSGQNFFNMLFDYNILTYSKNIFLINIFLALFEILVTFYILVSLIYFVDQQLERKKGSYKECFYKSFGKLNILIPWAILNLTILVLCALLGFFGEIFQFFWQLSTSLSLQIIAFENKTVIGTLKDSFAFLKKLFGNLLGIDLLIDILLLIFLAIFYYIYKSHALVNLTTISYINFLLIIIFSYLISMVVNSEVLTFTALYKIFHKHPEELDI